jgi:hypothetical protein
VDNLEKTHLDDSQLPELSRAIYLVIAEESIPGSHANIGGLGR